VCITINDLVHTITWAVKIVIPLILNTLIEGKIVVRVSRRDLTM
jgi:hypothetical protein